VCEDDGIFCGLETFGFIQDSAILIFIGVFLGALYVSFAPCRAL